MTAAERLAEALLNAINERIPCQGPHSDWWTSDDAEEREAAARQCQGCPVIEACAAAADEADERWHVWGGVDRTHHQSRGRRAGRRNRRDAA